MAKATPTRGCRFAAGASFCHTDAIHGLAFGRSLRDSAFADDVGATTGCRTTQRPIPTETAAALARGAASPTTATPIRAAGSTPAEMTRDQLRDALGRRSVPTNGRKVVLLERLHGREAALLPPPPPPPSGGGSPYATHSRSRAIAPPSLPRSADAEAEIGAPSTVETATAATASTAAATTATTRASIPPHPVPAAAPAVTRARTHRRAGLSGTSRDNLRRALGYRMIRFSGR